MKTKTRKHIEVIEKYFYPVTAGIEVNTLETYSVLVKKDWKVTVHTSKDSLTEKNVFPDNEVVRGIKVKRYPFKWYGFIPEINWRKTDVVALHNFDIFPHFFILVYCLILKLLRKKRFALILTPHGGFSLDRVWHLYPWRQRVIKKAYHHSLASWLINRSVDGVRAVSEWEKQQMLSLGVDPKKVVVISNGLEDEAYMDIEKLASSEIKGKVCQWGKYLIRIGRIYPIKNDETIIRALPKVPKDVKLVIVGPIESNKFPQYIDFLNRLIDELKLKDRVIFAGVIRGIDKYYAIKKSQTMVHMALWESFCNVVHEALSQGLVPIVANNTALPFLIKDNVNGYLINTHDHQSLSKKINYLIKNKYSKKHLKMSKKNIEFGKEHAWRRVAEKMGVFYQHTSKKVHPSRSDSQNENSEIF